MSSERPVFQGQPLDYVSFDLGFSRVEYFSIPRTQKEIDNINPNLTELTEKISPVDAEYARENKIILSRSFPTDDSRVEVRYSSVSSTDVSLSSFKSKRGIWVELYSEDDGAKICEIRYSKNGFLTEITTCDNDEIDPFEIGRAHV